MSCSGINKSQNADCLKHCPPSALYYSYDNYQKMLSLAESNKEKENFSIYNAVRYPWNACCDRQSYDEEEYTNKCNVKGVS